MSSKADTGLAARARSAGAIAGRRRDARPTLSVFIGVLAVLLAVGWAANHFAALMPVIGGSQHLSAATLDAVFGIYAVGLLPGLLIGGPASDAFGRHTVAWAGTATVLAGTVGMLVSQQSGVLLAGRLIVGAGVGLAMTSCTAWASDLRGPAGAATAGAVLIAGFAIGPFVAGVVAWAGRSGVQMSFAIAAALVVAATSVTVVAVLRSGSATPARAEAADSSAPVRQGAALALSWALPLAPWVFASATLAFVAIPTRIHTGLPAPMAAGVAALVVNGASGLIQIAARARAWGAHAGTAGAALAALGYAVTALAPPAITPQLGLPLFLVLGCASGLSLRGGLIDLETAAPQHIRGTLTGVFYAMTYIGFGLPLLLADLGSPAHAAPVLGIMAVLASVTAGSRAVRLRRDA
ncbi:MFS transporter [Mycobacterium parmense]|nr:MFS transporter [Mycobacterium parmense]MCV7349914.1 MFS transporter [Mycobacterium parmense]ORW59211.1 MFS transporter [Mycobacterium parmense]